MKRGILIYLFAATCVIALSIMASDTSGQNNQPVLCHAETFEAHSFIKLVLPHEELALHLDESGAPLAGHEEDYLAVDADCERGNDAGSIKRSPSSTLPEPVAMLLFGTGLAGVGYASRRYLTKRGEERVNDEGSE